MNENLLPSKHKRKGEFSNTSSGTSLSQGKKERHTTLKQYIIDDSYEKYVKQISSFLDKQYGEPIVYSAVFALKQLKRKNQLNYYLRETNYWVFHWGMENDNPMLIKGLLELLSERRKFLMLSAENYAEIKNFVYASLSIEPTNYKLLILNKLNPAIFWQEITKNFLQVQVPKTFPLILTLPQ